MTKMQKRNLKTKGEVDFDYKHDILFFKFSEREYNKSIEFENLILDIDTRGFITGLQILEASKFFNISKNALLKIPRWELKTSVNNGVIEIRLIFNVEKRNKIIEKNPIIMQHTTEPLRNSQLVCVA